MMFFEEVLDGKKILIECNKIALDSYGIVLSSEGTKVLCTVSIGDEVSTVFKPLCVNVIERSSAVNNIPYGFKKRDMMSDSGVLMSRLIDKAIRPFISDDFSRSINLSVHVISYKDYAIEPLGVLGASLILNCLGIINRAVSLIKISETTVNAANKFNKKFRFFNVVSDEKSFFIDYEVFNTYKIYASSVFDAYALSCKHAYQLNSFQYSILKKMKFIKLKYSKNFIGMIDSLYLGGKVNAYVNAFKKSDKKTISLFQSMLSNKNYTYNSAFKNLVIKKLTSMYHANQVRLDGRDFDLTRSFMINKESSNTSFVFMGGNEILISLVKDDLSFAKIVESLDGSIKQNFMVQFSFLSSYQDFSKNINSLTRLEIENSEFIRRSFALFIKDQDKAIRVGLDVLNADGACLAASVCATSVLLKKANYIFENVAAVSIGAFFIKNIMYCVNDLSFIDELACDITAKVVGNLDNITGIQLTSKVNGFSEQDFVNLIEYSKIRLSEVLPVLNEICNSDDFIVKNMENKIDKQNNEQKISKNKDSYTKDIQDEIKRCFRIEVSDIGLVIGRNGSVIKGIQNKFNVKINISDNGNVEIISSNHQANIDAMEYIKNLLK